MTRLCSRSLHAVCRTAVCRSAGSANADQGCSRRRRSGRPSGPGVGRVPAGPPHGRWEPAARPAAVGTVVEALARAPRRHGVGVRRVEQLVGGLRAVDAQRAGVGVEVALRAAQPQQRRRPPAAGLARARRQPERARAARTAAPAGPRRAVRTTGSSMAVTAATARSSRAATSRRQCSTSRSSASRASCRRRRLVAGSLRLRRHRHASPLPVRGPPRVSLLVMSPSRAVGRRAGRRLRRARGAPPLRRTPITYPRRPVRPGRRSPGHVTWGRVVDGLAVR